MSNNHNRLKTQLLSFLSYIFPAAIGILSFMLLVRAARPEVLGQFIIYTTAVIMFEMIKAGGLQSAVVMRMSGADEDVQKTVIGSAFFISGLFSISLSIILFLLYILGIFKNNPGFEIFCGWYAILGIITVPIHIADSIGVARQQFKFLVFLRTAQGVGSLVIALYAFATPTANLQQFATVHLLFNVALFLIVLISGKSNPGYIKFKTLEEVKKLIGFIKYALGTMATTNFLKSADTFLIGSMMGPLAVARYAIPLKLTELFDIPLRSLSSTAFPQLAANHNAKDTKEFKQNLVQYISWAYMVYIPALIIAFIFAPQLVYLIGGEKFQDTTLIFRVFVLYGFFLPLDRMTGISLDAMQRPDKNFTKVLIMASVNLVADLLAITFTHSLEWVAFASAINAATGVYIGVTMLRKIMQGPSNNLGALCVNYSRSFLKKGYKRYVEKVA